VKGAIPGLLICCLSGSLAGQSDRWDRQVEKGLAASAATLTTSGYRPLGQPWLGMLFVDESVRLEIPLARGEEYVVIGTCDEDCTGLELVLASPTGYEIDAARQPGRAKAVRVTDPAVAGIYRLTVKLAGCRISPCRYGAATFVRRRP
jgi:hypothetical protein